MTDRKEEISREILTPDQVRAWLFEHGVSQRQVARKLGCNQQVIVGLLNGRIKGTYGKSHRAAVALRLKPPARGESPLRLIELSQDVDPFNPCSRGALRLKPPAHGESSLTLIELSQDVDSSDPCSRNDKKRQTTDASIAMEA